MNFQICRVGALQFKVFKDGSAKMILAGSTPVVLPLSIEQTAELATVVELAKERRAEKVRRDEERERCPSHSVLYMAALWAVTYGLGTAQQSLTKFKQPLLECLETGDDEVTGKPCLVERKPGLLRKTMRQLIKISVDPHTYAQTIRDRLAAALDEEEGSNDER